MSLYSTFDFPHNIVQPDDSATHEQSWSDELSGQLTDFLANMNETSTFTNVPDQMILDLSSHDHHRSNTIPAALDKSPARQPLKAVYLA